MAQNDIAKLYYFAGLGRAETTRWMLAASQIAFENVVISTAEELDALRASGKLPFDQLPLLEIDRFRISQTTALLRYLARRGDLYGDDAADALWCDMIVGVATDLVEPAIVAAFQPTRAAATAGLRQRMEKFASRLEQRLCNNGSRYIAAKRLSFADVVLAEALSAHVELEAEILHGYPLLNGLLEAVSQLPGIAAYLTSCQRWPLADEDYVINVARVLRRPLPPHMPYSDRFMR